MAPNPSDPDDGFGPDTYGRGFADVYDRWYPPDDSTDQAVRLISELAGPAGHVLELGVGTGRLAVPLAAAGHTVVGLDSSAEMLEQLAAKLGPDSTDLSAGRADRGRIDARLVDLADAGSEWPPGPVDVVVAAFNLICNLVDPATQESLFLRCARVLRPGGRLVVETFVAEPVERRERHLEVRQVTADAVVLIASDTDPVLSLVTGQHIELRDGEPVRLRPWRLRFTSPDELDRWAVAAGFTLEAVWSDWAGTTSDGHDASATRIACYRNGEPDQNTGL
uniref:Methyltransferase n=1 Tax=uncultured bacterium A1Q1_fos_568 TaxID=1256586 RepID=L7VVW0_9BACT|nr:methyltransferase [uncultured bacterium A1Q1_fos_568]